MRLGEILALTWAGVDLFRKTVTVFRSKNGERRTVPVNQTVMALFKDRTKWDTQDRAWCSQVELGHLLIPIIFDGP